MKLRSFFIISCCAFLLFGCNSYRKVPYLQETYVKNDTLPPHPMYDAKIMPKDLLTITVNTTDPESANLFNLTAQSSFNSARSSSLSQSPTLQQYLVSNEGTIEFPVLGSLQISGLTKSEAESLIRDRLSTYLKEKPIVTVRRANYKISVLGEVTHPNIFTISHEKINIFEALSLAGDLTIWGMRDNVKLIRENFDGQSEVITLNLNKTDIVASPYYYLRPNDVLYVTPNKAKAKNSDVSQSTSLWFSAISVFASVANIIATFLLLL
ncbi:MAG: polysaccharide biosynthesis/export family protein [Bacteroidaceae bacterium]|nr:polysaccharide biosynthesis/export family protein [Bacteroidaceae bacterium]